MNRQVLGNLDNIITALQADPGPVDRRLRMRTDNTRHIIAASRRRHEFTRARAIQVLRTLDVSCTPVTFESVARFAGVSRSWLYAQPDIRAETERLRGTSQRGSGPSEPARVRRILAPAPRRSPPANRQLAEENRQLRDRLAHALGMQRSSQSRDLDRSSERCLSPPAVGPCS
jgi:Family of unknown function (DUF6262)